MLSGRFCFVLVAARRPKDVEQHGAAQKKRDHECTTQPPPSDALSTERK